MAYNNFVKDIKARKLYRELDLNNQVLKEPVKSNYPHLTFKVKNLSEYIMIVSLLSSTVENDSYLNRTVIYRGMSNEDWELEPSLSRCMNHDYSLEYNLVNNFIVTAPSEFSDLKTSFEILSKMQHYGLPTRLLDFTRNPLIALFFACDDNSQARTNARVVCHRAYIEIAENDIIEKTCGIYKREFFEDTKLDDLFESPFRYLHRLYRISSDRLLVARPAYWNKRIQNQQAIFMVFPNKMEDEYARWAYFGEENFPQIWEQELYRKHLETIKKEPIEWIYENAKDGIFTINHETITRLFDYYKLNEDMARKTSFAKRFCFDSELEKVDAETLKNDFCSIVIEDKYKKIMLNQLKQVGIDKSFVYPELEYVAEKVKNMYVKER